MAEPERRKYDSPLRRRQAAETRERILAAGSELVHGFASWDWRELTVRAVARRAGVNERTVYRHFASERDLHEAVMARLHEEAGDPLDGLALDGLGPAVGRLFGYLASFATRPRTPTNPTFAAVDQNRRDALLDLVAAGAGERWSEDDRRLAAALLDLLWSTQAYELLVGPWELDTEQASRAVAGLIDLLVGALRSGEPPWTQG
jgi:AcrR family transcriptional regulator